MPVSIEDVARLAGVSPGTVSHVLNGNVQARIAKATQERVQRAAAELGYHPNRMARSLGRKRTDTIGLMLPGVLNIFFAQILERMERQAWDAGYHVLLDAPISQMGIAHHQTRLRGWPVDGVLIWAWPNQTVVDYLGPQAKDMPAVYLSGQPREDESDAVYFDVYGGTRAAMEYLLQRGYRRIGFLYPYPWVVAQSNEPRYKGYREVCAEAGIPLQCIEMGHQEETRRSGWHAGQMLANMSANERPEALLCFNDVVAQGVLFALRHAGLRVPDDIAIVGFDGLEEGHYLDTPLTTVVLPIEHLCQQALQLLLCRMRDGAEEPAHTVVIPTVLFPGATA